MHLFANLRRRLRTRSQKRPASWEHRKRPCSYPTMHIVHYHYGTEYNSQRELCVFDSNLIIHYCQKCDSFHVVDGLSYIDVKYCAHPNIEPHRYEDIEMDTYYRVDDSDASSACIAIDFGDTESSFDVESDFESE